MANLLSIEEAILTDDVRQLVKHKRRDIAQYCCKVMNQTALQLAHCEDRELSKKLLLRMPCAVQAQNGSNENFIEFILMREGILGVIKLETQGIDIMQENKHGENILHYAAKNDDYNFVLTTYIKPEDLTKKNTEGLTILEIAALSRSKENLNTLLNRDPSRASRLLRLSNVSGEIRGQIQSVADRHRLKQYEIDNKINNITSALKLKSASL